MQLFIVPIYLRNTLNNLYSADYSYFKKINNKNCSDFIKLGYLKITHSAF